MPLFALQHMGIAYKHVFSSDNNAACKKIILGLHSPDRFYDDAQQPKHKEDRTDLYCSGFPCQPYASGGKHKGDEDPRAMVDESLDYISSFKPTAVMMENVPGLMTTHKSTLDKITNRLRQDGYLIKHRILNSKDHGVFQNRRRMYLVAVRKDKLKKDRKFSWPTVVPLKGPLPLDRLTADDDPKTPPPKSQSGGLPRRLLKRSIRECLAEDIDPAKTCVFTDILCTERLFTKRVRLLPRLTSRRGYCGGYWVSTRGRLTTTSELCRFQGLDPSLIDYESLGVSKRQMGAMLGNTMTLPVCGQVLRMLLYSAGLISELPKNPWGK